EIYIYDGSPIICWTDETDTVRCNFSIYSESWISDRGFIPVSSVTPVDMGNYDLYHSEFTTRDTGLAIEKIWIAPNSGSDSCTFKFLIQAMKIYAIDGETHEGLAIGETVDWDVPADSGYRNRSGFDVDLRLMYQQGSEYDQDPIECQENSDRYGGLALLDIYENGEASTYFHGIYTDDNTTQVYPFEGFNNDSLYLRMGERTGYTCSDSLDADLHMIHTFRYDYTLTPTDTFVIYELLVTGKNGYGAFFDVIEGGFVWYEDHIQPQETSCCRVMGDWDHDGMVTISDLVCLVGYMFQGGICPPPPCPEEVWLDGDNQLDIGDLVALVNYMFNSGPELKCP
ncbi:MAG: hypothetical protein U9R56_06745, partial [candidate division Zixibacteria bacterium]|nr:hypothetical protein [candidate division Zixibacteria bacterium]